MKQKVYYAIGGMSGTSLDGVDLSYCRYFKAANGKWQFDLIEAKTYPYPRVLKAQIKKIILNYTNNYAELDQALGAFYASLVMQFIAEFSIGTIDFFANHGQTVYHKPAIKKTVQLGCGKTMAKLTGLRCINNFRINDVALGGQGAPLVPIGDWHFFGQYRYCINLGGIANITILTAEEVLVAFDVCPCNVLLNWYAHLMDLPYDENGALARKGQLNAKLLRQLNELPYYHQRAPKSLDAQFSKEILLPIMDAANLPIFDVLHILCHHYAEQIALVIEQFSVQNNELLLLTGGGAFNGFLCETIQSKTTAKVHLPNKNIVEFKEAIIFGLLGVLKLENEVNCLKVVTGASEDNVGGVVFR